MRSNHRPGFLHCALMVTAQPGSSPAGQWEGDITLPGTALAIRVDLEMAADMWSGSIDIPAQSLRGFKLGDITVGDANVSFTKPGIPGEPKFAGMLTAFGKTISGDFSKAGQKHPFKLERKPMPAGGRAHSSERGGAERNRL